MRTLVATEPDEGDAESGDTPPEPPSGRSIPSWMVTFSLVGVAVLGIALRFVTTSKLWLDEALTVNMWEAGDGEVVFTTAAGDRVVIDQGLLRYS